MRGPFLYLPGGVDVKITRFGLSTVNLCNTTYDGMYVKAAHANTHMSINSGDKVGPVMPHSALHLAEGTY